MLGRRRTRDPSMADHRRSARFSWNLVDETLIRKLLRAAYTKFGPPEQAQSVSSLTPEQLRRNAERVLGRLTTENARYPASKRDRAGHFIDLDTPTLLAADDRS